MRPATAIRLSWLAVRRWRPLIRVIVHRAAAAVRSMTDSAVMSGRASTAYL
jgi:hypothetical protein